MLDTFAASGGPLFVHYRRRANGKETQTTSADRANHFDRQIVAICKTKGVKTIYSDDEGLRTFAERNGIDVVGTWELPEPPADPQMTLTEVIEREETARATVEGGTHLEVRQGTNVRKVALDDMEL